MQPNTLTREEVVEFANLLYGDAWRDTLSKRLNISRKQLVLTLASDDPLPESITLPLLSLIEEHVQDQELQRRKMAARVAEIRRASERSSQPQVMRKSAS